MLIIHFTFHFLLFRFLGVFLLLLFYFLPSFLFFYAAADLLRIRPLIGITSPLVTTMPFITPTIINAKLSFSVKLYSFTSYPLIFNSTDG
jgi:hypothetical protein